MPEDPLRGINFFKNTALKQLFRIGQAENRWWKTFFQTSALSPGFLARRGTGVDYLPHIGPGPIPVAFEIPRGAVASPFENTPKHFFQHSACLKPGPPFVLGHKNFPLAFPAGCCPILILRRICGGRAVI